MAFLPDELWQYVLYHATDNPARRQWESDGPLEIAPFEAFHEKAERQLADEALSVKASVCLVCSKWRNLSAKYLFEDIRIRQGSFALAGKLEQRLPPSSDTTFGGYVRRIIIPVIATAVWRKTLEVNARRILVASPNIQILARRLQERFRKRYPRQRNTRKGAIDDVQLPHLRRVDWNNTPVYYYRGEDEGIPNFIWNTPSLEILSLSDHDGTSQSARVKGFPWCPKEETSATNSTSLTTIHTLRLDCRVRQSTFVNILGTRLSSIRHLILHRAQGANFRTSCLDAYGPQLQVVEMSFRPPGYRHDIELPSWSDVLSSCPNIIFLHSHIRHVPMIARASESGRPKNGSLKGLKLLMRKKDIANELLEIKKLAIFDTLVLVIKDRTIFPSLTHIELHGSGWMPLYGESIGGLQLAAEESQVNFSFQAMNL